MTARYDRPEVTAFFHSLETEVDYGQGVETWGDEDFALLDETLLDYSRPRSISYPQRKKIKGGKR